MRVGFSSNYQKFNSQKSKIYAHTHTYTEMYNISWERDNKSVTMVASKEKSGTGGYVKSKEVLKQ